MSNFQIGDVIVPKNNAHCEFPLTVIDISSEDYWVKETMAPAPYRAWFLSIKYADEEYECIGHEVVRDE